MILYRGTPKPETRPRPREYACAFFSPNAAHAAEYGDYVQKYRMGPQRILDFGDPDARRLAFQFTGHKPSRRENDPVMLDLFWHPTEEWRDIVRDAGYSGTAMGWNVCVFDLSGIELLGRWRAEWKDGSVRLRRIPGR